MRVLADLAVRLQEKLGLEELLSLVVTAGSEAIGCPQTSLRLLDATRTRLLVTARAGRSVHERGDVSFSVGEGLVGWVAEHARPICIADAHGDPRFAARPDMTVAVRSFLGVPLVASGQCIGVLSAARPEPGLFGDADLQAFQLLAALAAPRLEIARLERLTGVDPLTGALNRRGLEGVLAQTSIAPPLAVAMADIDRFKVVNDTHGHDVGDVVLREVTRILSATLRSTDVIVRMGGEEFMLVLPGASGEQARMIAERARAHVEASRIVTSAGPVPVTISIGVASMRPAEPWTDVVRRADHALCARAKPGGRNRVVAEEDAEEAP